MLQVFSSASTSSRQVTDGNEDNTKHVFQIALIC